MPRSEDGVSLAGTRTEDPVSPMLRAAIDELLLGRGYPADWADERIRPEAPDTAAVLNRRGRPFLLLRADAQALDPGGLSELEALLLASAELRLVIAFDGSDHAVVRKTPGGIAAGELPSWRRGGNQGEPLPCDNLRPLTERVENVFFELHSTMRDADGLHADQALDEVCRLILAKAHDEDTHASDCQFRAGIASCDEEVASVLHGLYGDASAGLHLRSQPNKTDGIGLSDAALMGCVRLLEPYAITRSPTDIRGRAFQRVIGPALRAGMGQYFTPSQVIRFMVQVVRPIEGEHVLDPFAGSAGFLAASLDALVSARARNARGTPSPRLFGIEKSDRMIRVAATDLRLHGDGIVNLLAADSLSDFATLDSCERASFDVVLTNPPFGSLLGKEAIAQLNDFDLAVDRNTVPLEVLGLERCVQFLKPGGRLGIVLPEGIFVNRKAAYVRRWLLSVVEPRAIVSLPIETFAPFGANVKTSILFARRLLPGETADPARLATMVRVGNVGYDASGRVTEGDDLQAAADSLNAFFEKEGW